jgi:ankyrin repeat protein
VQQGANINQSAGDGWTPLFVATIAGHTAMVNYLREQGAV